MIYAATEMFSDRRAPVKRTDQFSRPSGTRLFRTAIPALKRWASFGGPSGTEVVNRAANPSGIARGRALSDHMRSCRIQA
jgi:hypothetical protein